MLIVKTKTQEIRFNMRNFEVEKNFKEIALNHVIDQTGKRLLMRFCHADHETKIGEQVLDTKELLRIEFKLKKFYENYSYYSIKNLTTEEPCR